MLMSFLPTGIMAYDTREEELAARYEEMLDLGLIDEDGALIENNAFRLDDGTGFDTLPELEEWMNTLSESDADIVVTVVSTGKTATVAEIAQALSIERDLGDRGTAEYTRERERGGDAGSDELCFARAWA